METTKNKTVKTEAVKTEVNEKVKNLVSILVAREQKFLYKWQTESPKPTAKQAKQLRQKIRRIVENFYFQICVQKNAEKKAEAVKQFLAFYKANYILNDFTIQSLSESHDEAKKESYKQMLEIVKASLTK